MIVKRGTLLIRIPVYMHRIRISLMAGKGGKTLWDNAKDTEGESLVSPVRCPRIWDAARDVHAAADLPR